jgi:hypothetical protein
MSEIFFWVVVGASVGMLVVALDTAAYFLAPAWARTSGFVGLLPGAGFAAWWRWKSWRWWKGKNHVG